MNAVKYIFKWFSAILLLVVLAIPTAIQFSHALENHTHTICNNNDEHLHQADLDCSLCEYHITSYNFNLATYPDFEAFILIKNKPTKLTDRLQSKSNSNPKQLRAPPLFYLT